ncbi:SDR family NAD(P)-dependent oxidoreductase [SAR202 cluster bacterium AC-409-J13_OGT_754m]|nr:SDR family NAD(P)-dependent oxidoreductase [SAR202 cluster bacterium AC-409-J13_OGT_754m]
MELGLKGKVAIITGGSDGIGKATAIRLGQEGANTVIIARREDVLEKAASEIRGKSKAEIITVVGDVTKKLDIQRTIETAYSKFGRIDILVNNAGRSSANQFENVEDSIWETDLDLKLFAAIRFSRDVIPYMRKIGSGRIINVTAISGKTPGKSSLPTSVTRAAGIALTKAMSKDLAEYNILVNTVCIGVIKSGQQSDGFMNQIKVNKDLTIETYYNQIATNRAVPLGRVGESQEAGDVIAFLASERASYLTGISINIDGGISAST